MGKQKNNLKKKKGMELRANTFLVLLLLSFISLIALSHAVSARDNIILDKSVYRIDETVTITLNNITPNDTLSIISDQDVFKYSGELESELQFYPRETGEYVVRLSNDEIIYEANFSVVQVYEPAIQDSSQLYTDKKEYLVNEPVLIHVNATEEYDLAVITETEVFKYLGLLNELLPFIPQYAGIFKVELRKDFLTIATTEFSVVEQVEQVTNQNINLTVLNTSNVSNISNVPNTQNISQEIPSQEATTATATPTEIQPVAETITGNVSVPESVPESPEAAGIDEAGEGLAEKELTEEEQLSITLPARLELKDNSGTTSTPSIQVLRAAGDSYDIELFPQKVGISNIKLNNLKIVSDKSLLFDEVSLRQQELKQSFRQKNVIRSFFVDASELNFTNGTITSTAAGRELWKCKEWNSTLNTCLGRWEKIMDLTPGEEYSIILEAGDPAYAETGLASINTKKPIYYPGENAEIIIVVLDATGHLVRDADVSLAITAPNNTTSILATSNNSIIETSTGIYETVYSGTSQEGSYDMFVSANGRNVNSSMQSSFEVKSYYEFDIIRSTPVTTDPWKGAFDSSISLVSHASTGTNLFDFTEIIPANFEITNTGGSTVSTNGNKTSLTWTGLANNSVVSYSAKPPLVTPDLYELGPSYISYTPDKPGDSNIFFEARPWYLAVDPATANLTPNADGSYTTWTIGGTAPAATRWESVDDPPGSPDTTTTYIISPSNTNRNSFLFQSLSPSQATVQWVDISINARRAQATGTGVLQMFYRQGGTDYNNANTQTLTATWTTYSLASWNYTTNPATSAPWNLSTVNSMEWGVYRASGNRVIWVTQMYVTVGYSLVPNITNLTFPANNSVIASTSIVNFSFNVTDDENPVANCTLWGNFTGSWEANKTVYNSKVNNITNISLALPDGTYLWNIQCIDNYSGSGFYKENYTVLVEYNKPPRKTIVNIDNDNSAPWNTTNRNPYINVSLNKDGTCRLSKNNESFADMSNDYNCTGAGTSVSNCTYTGTILSIGTTGFFIACNDTRGNADTNATNLYFTLDVLCDSHSDCTSGEYCDYTQQCHPDELAGYPCNTQAYTGLGWNEVCGDGANSYCVNDSSYYFNGWYCTGSATDCVYNDQGKSFSLGETLCNSSNNDYKNCSLNNQWGSTFDCGDLYDPYNQSATYHAGGYCNYYATAQSCVNGTTGGCSGSATSCSSHIYNQTTTTCGSLLADCDLGCGAGCDPSNSTTPGILSGTCYYDKSCSNACAWSQSSEQAPEFCINDNNGGACAYSVRTNPTTSETCYWSATCLDGSGASLASGTANNLRQDYCDYCNATGNQTGQYSPAPNASCYSSCSNSGTIYYDSGATPGDRSDECSNGVTTILSDTLSIGDVWNSTGPAYCNSTECSLDCSPMSGACNAGVCECTDTDNPIIMIISPTNGIWTNNPIVTFRYNVTDISSGIQNCSLIINSTINMTNTTINESLLEQVFTRNFTNRTMNWSIRCYDNSTSKNMNQSGGRFLGVDTSVPLLRNASRNQTNFTVNKKVCLNITANDTYSGISQVIATIRPPGQPDENITLSDSATTSCDSANGNNVYSAEYLLIFSGTYNWTAAYAIDFANNINTTIPRLTWNVTAGGVLIVNMTYPAANIRINESEFNNYYIQNCTVKCNNSGANCTNVTLFVEYFTNLDYFFINTTTTDLISNRSYYTCGNLTRNYNCTALFNITSGINSGNRTYPVRCRADSINSATALSATKNVSINDHPYPHISYPQNDAWVRGIVNINASTSFDSDGSIVNYLFEYDNNTAFSSPSTICNSASSNCTWNTTQQSQCNNNTMDCYLRVTVRDNDGLTNSTYILLGFDTQGPTTILAMPRNFENISTNSFTAMAASSDDESGMHTVIFEYRENSTATWKPACNDTSLPYECEWSTAGLSDGNTYEFRAYANDSLGNIGGADSHTNITIDRAGPVINLESPENNYFTANSTVVFYYNATDAHSNIANCSLIIHGILNQSNITITEGQSQNFTLVLGEGAYNWSINCTDVLGNTNASATRNITIDNTGPVTLLDLPPDYAQITGASYTVNASAIDQGTGNISTIAFEYRENNTAEWKFICNDNIGPTYDCIWDLTSLEDGTTYEVRAWANDTLGNNGSYSTHAGITIDNDGPSIYDVTPSEGALDADGNVTFSFKVSDVSSGIANCSLIINGSINQTNSSISEDAESYFYLYNQNDKAFNWSIECWDNFSGGNHMGSTGNISLTIQILYTLRASVTSMNGEYEKGNQESETINLTTATTDFVDAPIDASVITDIIATQGESRNIWWDTTWKYRTRATLNETYSIDRESQWIHLSFILDPDCLNLAHRNSLRLVKDVTSIPEFNEWNVSYCADTNYIRSLWVSFRLNLSANASTNIYIYFDNSTTMSKTSTSRGPMRMIWVSTGGSGNAPASATIRSDLNTALGALGLNYTTFYNEVNTNAASTDLTFANISGYAIAYYDSGAKYGNSWDSTEGNALFQFVNQSGNLFLTGQDLGYDANTDGWIYNAAFGNLTRISAGWVDNANPSTFTIAASHPVTQYIGSLGSTVSVAGDYEDGYTTLAGSTSVRVLNWTGSATPTSGTANDGLTDPGCSGFCGRTVYYSGVFYISATQGIQSSSARSAFLRGAIEWFLNENLTESKGGLEKWVTRNSTGSTGPEGIWSWLLSATELSNGSYQAVSQASKPGYNNATAWASFNITLDSNGPIVNLQSPSDRAEANSSVTFAYYVNDTLSSVSNCSLLIDDQVETTDYTVLEGPKYFYPRIPLGGWHNWSVNCTDYYGNIGASEKWEIYIKPPDLVVTGPDIIFSNSTPKEGDNITINATVFNLGGSDAQNVIMQIFLGDPDSGGVQLGKNFTANITELTGNQPNYTFSISWITPGPGPFEFYVVVDPPTTTNGSIFELNESNNKAKNTMNIPAYNYFYGSVESNIYLGDLYNQSLYFYTGATNVTGNIFVSDEGASISFSSVQALGRDVNNNTASNDFSDLDSTLNTTGYNDSIRKIWTENTDIPTATKSIAVFNRQVNNIPIIKSTSMSNFITGILWDTSDGGTQYNGTQDILFITQINESQAGGFGTYDYEIRLPANLRNYHGTGTNVEFYSEMI